MSESGVIPPPEERQVRARDVQIVKSFQAICYRANCHWTGDLRSTHQAANDERIRHLGEHADDIGELPVPP